MILDVVYRVGFARNSVISLLRGASRFKLRTIIVNYYSGIIAREAIDEEIQEIARTTGREVQLLLRDCTRS